MALHISVILISILNIMIKTVTSHYFVGHTTWTDNFNNLISETQRKYPPFNDQTFLEKITTEERIASFGYPVELHEVTTADGYILTMHRIPQGKRVPLWKRKPVLLQHGGFGDSFCWLFNHQDKILALQLADEGYDIWLANARGTLSSRKHTHFTDRDRQFFDFSIDEYAMYDVPAQIDYILNVTGEAKLIFMGISLGSPLIHMTLSLFPEYNSKLSLITQLAPTIYVQNILPLMDIAGYTVGRLPELLLDFVSGGTGELPPPLVTQLLRTSIRLNVDVCTNFFFLRKLCNMATYIAYGEPMQQSKVDLVPLVVSHSFCPISTKVAYHFFQQMSSGRFQQYDFGVQENIRVYGSVTPPLYFLNATTVPVAVFYTSNDIIVVEEDVKRTISELPNVVLSHCIDSCSWNHVDFLTGQDVNEVFNNHVTELFKNY